ncbi:hypothetical protein Daus18300_008842 [Diaporthe australafricana]|uniref:Chromatin modification-related protein EAF6 n=1 Tax=Diaporthe australafricana TaxID=127596 RepID=A0ABR3WGD6_9PEZI
MPPKKKIKLTYNPPNNPPNNQTSTDPDDFAVLVEARRSARPAARRAAREDFDPPFEIDQVDEDHPDEDHPDEDHPDEDHPDEDHPDEDHPDEDLSNEDRPDEDRLDEDCPDEDEPDAEEDKSDSDPQPASQQDILAERSTRANTRANTRVNTGFTTTEGLHVAQEYAVAHRTRRHLSTLAAGPQGYTADQDAPGECLPWAPYTPSRLSDYSAFLSGGDEPAPRRNGFQLPWAPYTSPRPSDHSAYLTGRHEPAPRRQIYDTSAYLLGGNEPDPRSQIESYPAYLLRRQIEALTATRSTTPSGLQHKRSRSADEGFTTDTAHRYGSQSSRAGYTGPIADPASILGGNEPAPRSQIDAFTATKSTTPRGLQQGSSSSVPATTGRQAVPLANTEPKATPVIVIVAVAIVIVVVAMTENNQTSAGADAPGGLPFYEQSRAQLKSLLAKRRELENKLANIETDIKNGETTYLDGTPAGNIMTGFDNYTKGTGAAAAQRRKGATMDQHRVFSRSSISYNANAADSTANTPGSSHAPTPVSATFAGGSGSNHPTPTSATASTGKAGGGGGGGAGSKKDKKKAVSLSVDAGDSESDINVKKVRANFGASRK